MTSPIREGNEDEDTYGELGSRLTNGVHINSSVGKQIPANGGEVCSITDVKSEADQNGTQKQASVFKSANWLSDSELIFSLTNQVGGLVRALRIFQELGIGIKHVESRRSRRRESEFEIFVDIDCSDQDKMKKLVHHLR